MERREFEKLPHKWDGIFNLENVNGIIILPSKIKYHQIIKYKIKTYLAKTLKFKKPEFYEVISGMHDSGFVLMDFVACENNRPLCRLSGCSDINSVPWDRIICSIRKRR